MKKKNKLSCGARGAIPLPLVCVVDHPCLGFRHWKFWSDKLFFINQYLINYTTNAYCERSNWFHKWCHMAMFFTSLAHTFTSRSAPSALSELCIARDSVSVLIHNHRSFLLTQTWRERTFARSQACGLCSQCAMY